MAKGSKSKASGDKTTRNLIIVAAVVVLIGVVAFFAEKQKVSDNQNAILPPGDTTGVQVLHLKPDQGCKLDETGGNYECNMLVRNTSDIPLEWFGQIDGLEGAALSNNGEGTVEPNNKAIVTLTVPVAFCDANPDGKGTVAIKDSEKSTDESLASFYCSDVEGEDEVAAE